MSFTTEVKAELTASPPAPRAGLLAECYGMVLPCVQPGASRIRLLTESADAAKRLAVLCEGLCGAPVELAATGSGYAAEVEQETGVVEAVLAALDIPRDAPALRLGRALLEEEGCAAAFLRGLFLAVGAVSDPGKEYRLELVVRYRRLAGDVAVLLEELGFPPARMVRRQQQVLYFKSSELVLGLLSFLGAGEAAARMSEVRRLRALTGEINRQTNSSLANMKRMADASARQSDAISRLGEQQLLEDLPEELREAAMLRLTHPEASLRELAQLGGLSRSTLDRRLKRLMELAERLETAQGDPADR